MSRLKPCPFCGTEVMLEKRPLWSNHGGYVGCYEFVIECSNPECCCRIRLGINDTIYNEEEEAKANAIKAWNHRYNEKEEG